MSNHIPLEQLRPLAGLLALLSFMFFVFPCIGDTDEQTVVVFKGGRTNVLRDRHGEVRKRAPPVFRFPAFVGGVLNGKEFFVVICDARYNGISDSTISEPVARTSYGDYKTWSDAEFILSSEDKSANYAVVGNVTAVIKDDKIYALVSHWNNAQPELEGHDSNAVWDSSMIVGTVVNADVSGRAGVSIKWQKGTTLKTLLPKTVLGAQGSRFIGGVGNGVVTKKGTIVFPVQIENSQKQVAASIMFSTNSGLSWQLGETTEDGTLEGSVVEWGEEKLLLVTRYDTEYRRVYESENLGKTWKESLMFSRVWGNQPYLKGVGCQGSALTVSVDEKDILLFSHPLNEKGGYTRDTLQLWMSDGQRIACVGTISEEGKGERSGYSILANIGDNLYVTHEINPFEPNSKIKNAQGSWDDVIALSHMRDFFESVKQTVRAWRQLDASFEAKGISADGLVGFLGTVKERNVWADMYNCVNATVVHGKPVDGGFRFNGAPGGGVQWPVRGQRQNQVYTFTNKQFTLAATVQIHRTNGAEYESLFGASETKFATFILVGLGFTKDMKWYVQRDTDVKITTGLPLSLKKEYHIALTFAKGVASVYVDGVEITKGKVTTNLVPDINHFYMCGMGNYRSAKGSSCTVKNVMLYNRVFNEEEIDALTKVSRESRLKGFMPTTEYKGKITTSANNVTHVDEGVSRSDGAAIYVSFFLWMCFVCPIIVLTVGV